MPRRWYTYPIQFATPNLLATVSGFIIGISVLIMMANCIGSWLRGPRFTEIHGREDRNL